jgi:hypothetical protein
MKKVYLILCIVMLIGLAAVAFIGCGGGGGVTTAADPTEACMVCHNAGTTNGDAVTAAGAQYENSGHYLGPRTLNPYEDTTGHMYVHHGSNAMYTNGTPCARCHTEQGFVDYAETGTAGNYGAASQPGCFACHSPHDTGGFGLRKTTPVVLETGDTFDYGKGNLCANCHVARDTVTSEGWDNPANFPGEVSSHGGGHHGPESDMIAGVNAVVFPNVAGGYDGVQANWESDHASTNACVDCHHFQPSGRLGGTLELGGHGFYLKGDVHGSMKYVTDLCAICHSAGFDWGNSFVNATSTHVAPNDWDGDGSTEAKLDEIQGLKDLLLAYFGTGSNFPDNGGAAGDGLIVSATTTGVDITGGVYNKDWTFATATSSMAQARAFWNFKYFVEDKSDGIHNPTFAGQMLWDAIMSLKASTSAFGSFTGVNPSTP